MNASPALTSERLILRAPEARDAQTMAVFVGENRAHLEPWEPTRPESYFTPSFWREEFARFHSLRIADQAFAFIILSRQAPDGAVLGRCALTNIVRGPFQAAHLGFALAGTAVGKGLMLEALTQVIAWAFTDLWLHRVMANYQPENTRSAALLQRLGFRIEGVAYEYLQLNGAWRDHVLASLINPSWRPA